MTLRANLNRLLSKHLPEQRIYLRTEATTRYLRLSPGLQLVLGLGAALLVCWTIIASATLAIDVFSASSGKSQIAVLQRAYETRLEELSGERDQRALEAQTAQDRFYIALEQISLQQNELLQAEEQRRELATGLKIMQRKLQTAVKERDEAKEQADIAVAELKDVTGSLSTRLGRAEDTEAVLVRLADKLEETVKTKEFIAENATDARQKLAEMQHDAQMQQTRNEVVLSRLETAVETGLAPLKRSLNKSGINTEALIRDLRSSFNGSGGPLDPLVKSSKGSLPDIVSPRANSILKELDRLNLMRMAARKVPLGHPVAGSYRYTSGYGYRRDPKHGGRRLHKGRDMAGPRGTPIVATADGVVSFAGRQSGYGKLIKIRHAQGFETFYAHLHRIRVKAGQRVSLGQRIGDMGNTGRSTGVHLHYEIRIGNKAVNPATYMN